MESNIQGKSFLKEVLTFPKLGTVLRSHHIAKSTTEQCGGSSSDWMKFCSSVSGKLKALKVVQLKEEEMLEFPGCTRHCPAQLLVFSKFKVTLSNWKVLLKGHKMLHKQYSKKAPPSQEEGPMQFLKPTEGSKISPERLIILCKFQLQP